MSEWPEGWFRSAPGTGNSPGSPGQADSPTVQVPAGPAARSGAPARPAAGGGWPAQPPPHREAPAGQAIAGQAAAPGQAAYSGGAAGSAIAAGGGRLNGTGRRRRLRPRRIFAVIAIIVALLLVAIVGTYFYFNGKLDRKNVLVDYAGRPAAGAGQNWLITGSDSRQGLTGHEERVLATGHDISGHRSDTILILHIPASGKPVLVSIPRDSYVPIPGHGYNKINAAYSYGGPELLAKTVQNATGLHIDHFMGIGFGGLVNVVNAVGGVNMCLPGPMVDPKAGLNLKAGCQTLTGAQALGFVRTRNFAESDLQREQDQRLFLRALLSKMTSLGTVINPFSALPAASGATGSLTVDQGTSLYGLLHVALALRNPQTTTVPIANASYVTAAGDSVLWNTAEAARLFHDLKTDTPVPRSLLTGSKVTGTG
jgi:LCP family protein required for cell wall assembly